MQDLSNFGDWLSWNLLRYWLSDDEIIVSISEFQQSKQNDDVGEKIHLVPHITVNACTVSYPWNPFKNVCILLKVYKQYTYSLRQQFCWDQVYMGIRVVWYDSWQSFIHIAHAFSLRLHVAVFQKASNIFKDKTPCFLLGFPVQTHLWRTFQ